MHTAAERPKRERQGRVSEQTVTLYREIRIGKKGSRHSFRRFSFINLINTGGRPYGLWIEVTRQSRKYIERREHIFEMDTALTRSPLLLVLGNFTRVGT